MQEAEGDGVAHGTQPEATLAGEQQTQDGQATGAETTVNAEQPAKKKRRTRRTCGLRPCAQIGRAHV